MKRVTLVFLFFLINGSLIFADESPPDTVEGDHEHKGFYFRFLSGFGYGYLHSTQVVNMDDVSQNFQNLSFQFGYTINKKIIVFIGMGTAVMPSSLGPLPFESAGSQLKHVCILQLYGQCDKGSGKRLWDYSVTPISGGVNYYFMPENIYVSMAIDLPEATYKNSNTPLGFGIQSAIGKEWWVSKNWGIGLALNIFYDYFPKTAPGLRVITPLHAFGIGLSFSATYN